MGQEPVYYKSDFDFLLPLKDAEGNAIGWPGHDWEARFTTAGNLRGYAASCIGGVCRNCVRDGEGIRIIADRHGLPPGRVMCEMTVRVPDSRYPDGTRGVAGLYELDIRLTDEPGRAVAGGEIRLPVIAGAARALPFLFGEGTYDGGAVFFNRELGRFILGDGSDAPAPYNETLADGRVAASREGRFECGGKDYRFTGSQLVNTEIERNPDRRLVRRCPTVDAHPGLAYIDRGVIRVPLGSLRPGQTFSVSVKGMWMLLDGRFIPLRELPPIGGGGVADLRFEEDTLTGRMLGDARSNCSDNAVCLAFDFGRETPDARKYGEGGTYIGIRYDNGGRKIFYRATGYFPKKEIHPPREDEAGQVLYSPEGKRHWLMLREVGRFEAQVWLRRRNFHTKRVCSRWFPMREHHRKIGHRCCLVRLRRVTGMGKSDWAYFHVRMEKDGHIGISSSRQRREL